MRILIISNEEWNDYTFANGVLTNWFTDFEVEVAQIYTSPGLPINNICDRYFQISEAQLAKSMIGKKRAGAVVQKLSKPNEIESAKVSAKRNGIYAFMKKLSLFWRTPIVMIRDFIGDYGRIDTELLRAFVSEFNPDLVFCPRYITKGLVRLESLVSTMTSAPFVAFTADDEISMENVRWWQLEYYRRWSTRRRFKKHVKLYSHYFTFSSDQAQEYQKEFCVPASTLLKCADFSQVKTDKTIGKPIRLVYAGHIYCNRWKTLSEIGKALAVINKDEVRMVLDVYTMDNMTPKETKALTEENYVYVKGAVTPSKLKQVYEEADIALHVESMDEHFRMVTRVSFSTKIIDLMASTCAILAICWDKHAGYQYLSDNDAAFCCSAYGDILPMLQRVCNHPELIDEYRQKAIECGKRNHSREMIHNNMLKVFQNAIVNSRRHEE